MRRKKRRRKRRKRKKVKLIEESEREREIRNEEGVAFDSAILHGDRGGRGGPTCPPSAWLGPSS